MSSLNIHLKNLNKQHGGSGIPFSEFMKQKRKSKRKTTVRKKSSRSPSRKRKVTRRTKKRKLTRKSNKKKRIVINCIYMSFFLKINNYYQNIYFKNYR